MATAGYAWHKLWFGNGFEALAIVELAPAAIALAFGYFEFAAVKPNTLSGYMRIAGYVLAIAAIGYAIMLLGVA